jgi:hypothetical protein
MKKSLLITCALLTTFSLTAFGFINWTDTNSDQDGSACINIDEAKTLLISPFVALEETDFFYDFGTRFRGVKKSTLEHATSINDFLYYDDLDKVLTYYTVSVIIIKNDEQTDIRETGKSDILTAGQIALLRSSEYSTNFVVRAEFQEKNKNFGIPKDNYFTPHLTIVPEKQAAYLPGRDALLNYFKESNKAKTVHLDKNKLQPAKLYFTVTKKGAIARIRLDRSCGYPDIDKNMIKLIAKAPGKWIPAENEKGEKVDQELVISFGLIGC